MRLHFKPLDRCSALHVVQPSQLKYGTPMNKYDTLGLLNYDLFLSSVCRVLGKHFKPTL